MALQDQDGRTIITSQEEFEKRCIDEHNNIEAPNVRLQFKLDLSGRKFRKCNFKGTVFEKDVNFKEARFYEDVFFLKSQFSGNANFEAVIFYGDAYFVRSTFSGDANFYFVKFSEASGIFMKASFFGYVNFKTSIFEKKANFRESFFGGNNAIFWGARFSIISLKGAIFENNSQLKGASINKGDRETYRIIKHEFLKINNRIDALEYHKREMKAYWRELFGIKKLPKKKWKIQKLQILKIVDQYFSKFFPNKLPEKFILIFNWLSTNYGTNWSRGVGFTLGTGLIFFLVLVSFLLNEPYFVWGWENWKEFWKVLDTGLEYYVQFLNPGHSFNFMKEFKPSPKGVSYAVDAIGRIFVTYGYYQTIQAFRKYKRI
jgi:uncharacterized protein YjbI with pentapeptide repeats